MPEVVVVSIVLLACAAIGTPLCYLLPSGYLAARFMIAPPIGLSLFSVGGTILYRTGISPWLSMVTMAAAGLTIGAARFLRRGPFRPRAPSKCTVASGAGIAAVILICLLPAWTGGPQFRIFQANVYDQMTFWAGSITARTHDYASIVGERPALDPVVTRGAWFIGSRGAVSIVHAAVADISHQGVIDSSYAFTVALQVNLLLAALFVLINVFSVARLLAFFLASALTIGFFQQFVFDINAWSELAAQPLYLLFVTFVVLAFDPRDFGRVEISAVARSGVILGTLAGGVLYLYPEGLAVYGAAAGGATTLALTLRESRRSCMLGLLALGSGAFLALSLSLLFWSGTIRVLFRQYARYSTLAPDWWHYFQRYLFGSETNYLANLADPASNTHQKLAAWFSLPIEAAASGLGLHFLLPSSSWPAGLAVAWKISLYCFLAMLLGNAIAAMMRIWRTSPAGSAARMIAACVAGCLVPVGVACSGLYWAAGTGLSMAAPMLFLLVCTPLLIKPHTAKGVASLTFALAHLALGIMRPILVTELAGSNIPGLPTATTQVREQKDELDWNERRWARELRSCRGVFLALDHPIMLQLVRRVAVDLGLPWAASIRPAWPEEGKGWSSAEPYLPNGWESFDCVASTSTLIAKPGQMLIWLSKDLSIFDFLKAPSAELEVGTKNVAGVLTRGLYGIESTARGPLQWASRVARFEVPNNPAAPARTLRLELWPMPLAAEMLKIMVDDAIVFDGAIPLSTVTVPLENFVMEDKLVIELKASAVTHYPRDSRDLGVAIKELQLSK